ncbi:MAG: hypothetical protein A2516_02205 [Alphaproteobacteria bacterium RIFOXYD12_FULL_60_8]|nr:MAG: hypothetical protein A2516_02205 [Alphaproteobacteria bacterium RIFOXYD12_FULL_60_8]
MTEQTQDQVTPVAGPAFALSDAGEVLRDGVAVAALDPGSGPWPWTPSLRGLDASDPEALEAATTWLKAHLAETLGFLVTLHEEPMSEAARGLAHKLSAAFGQLSRRPIEREIKALTEEDRKALTRVGIRFGVETLYMPLALKPAPQRVKSLLWTLAKGLPARPAMPTPGRVTFPPAEGVPEEFYEALGYRVLGGLVVRVDMLERFAAEVRHLTKEGTAELPHDLLSVLGIGLKEAKPLLAALSYTVEEAGEENKILRIGRQRKPRPPRPEAQRPPRRDKTVRKPEAPKPEKPAPKEPAFNPDSPFAVLKSLRLKG